VAEAVGETDHHCRLDRAPARSGDEPGERAGDPDVGGAHGGEGDALADDRRPVGAAWWHVHEPPLLHDTNGRALAELVMAVPEHARGWGVGTSPVNALAQKAAGRYRALMLNMHHVFEQRP